MLEEYSYRSKDSGILSVESRSFAVVEPNAVHSEHCRELVNPTEVCWGWRISSALAGSDPVGISAKREFSLARNNPTSLQLLGLECKLESNYFGRSLDSPLRE